MYIIGNLLYKSRSVKATIYILSVKFRSYYEVWVFLFVLVVGMLR
jgi:hypothetical protein